jgi:predicted transcriptional regulator
MFAPSEGPKAAPCGLSVTDGAWLATWLMSVWLRDSSMAELTAVMAIGVSCRFCARNCAVTTISSVWLSSAVSAVPA